MKLSNNQFALICLLLLDFADDFRKVKDESMQFIIYDFYISKIMDVIEGNEVKTKNKRMYK